MKRIALPLVVLLFSIAVFCPSLANAQSVASITGVVTDASGAVVQGATVSLVNPGNGFTYQAVTNSTGSYTIVNVAPGPGYKETISAPGFESFVVADLYLNVGNTRTQNAKLRAGVAQSVEVSAANEGVTINTLDATVGNNFQVSMVNSLPVQARDTPAALFSLQPGVTLTGAVNGARTDQNNVTLDGLDVNDFTTGQAFVIVGSAPVDSVQEFRGVTAGPLVSTGRGEGGQFELVTKSGTNQFHGALFEYHRDTATQANTWFNNNAIPKVPRSALIQNQFGGNIAGPILRDRLFFFFDYNDSRIVRSASVTRIVPLDSFRAGQISYIKRVDAGGNTCAATSRQNTTPGCIGTLTAAQVAALDPQHIGFDQSLLTFINGRFPHANDLSGGDGINTGSFRFNTPNNNFLKNYVGRADYNLTSSMKIFARVSFARQDSVQTAPQFASDPLTHPFQDRSYAYVLGHTWTIGTNKVNQIFVGNTIQRYNFPTTYAPSGINNFTFGGGTTSLTASPFSGLSSQRRRIPVPMVRDDFSWQLGTHNLQFGGTFKFTKTNSNLVGDFNGVSLGLGGNTLTLNSSLRPSDIRTTGTTAANTYDNAFALALGRVGAIASNYNYDNTGKVLPQGTGATRQYRYYETELYVGDTWKVNSSLALSYGLRYQLYTVPYETHGLESVQNFTFDQYFSTRVTQSASSISGNAALPFLTYNLGGKANNGPNLYNPSYTNFAPRFSFAYNPAFDRKTVFNGGAGIIYDHSVINAAAFVQDQNSYLFQNSATTQYGTSDPAASLLSDPRFTSLTTLPAPPTAPAISRPFQPYVTNGVPNGLAGNQFSTAIDPNLKNPYSIAFNGGIQHEFPGQLIFKASYAGRLGRRLLAQADASQLVDFRDATSGQQLSTAFANVTQQLRSGVAAASVTAQPWFENQVGSGRTVFLARNYASLIANGDFADFVQALAANNFIKANVGMASQFAENTYFTNKGSSNYHGLLLTLSKNLSKGLQFDFNYTWSHSIDNVSAIANFIASSQGYGFLCDAQNLRTCRGNSDFDVTHYVSADFIYSLPVGRGRILAGNAPLWLNEVIGGWEISGIPRWHTGNAFSTTTSAYVAGYANNAPAIFNGDRAAVAAHAGKKADGSVNLFADQNKALSAFTGPVGFTIGSRNNLRGPGYFNLDLGLGKNFPLYREKVNLKFRADAFNAFNHASFNTPFSASTTTSSATTTPANVDITSGTFGQITGTSTSARVLQGALRLEF